MICPLSPSHFVALGAFQLFAALLFFDASLAPLPLILLVLVCCIAPFFHRLSFFLPIVSRGEKGAGGVALTFDDGPDPEVTPRLLELLARHGVKATFFATGERAERYPELIRAILAGGHAIGNHSYSHYPFLMLKGGRTLRREVASAQAVFRRFGIVPLAFRPPVGITNPKLWRVLLENGMFCVNFSLRGPDLGNRWVAGLAQRLLRKLSPGDIVLLHEVAPRQGGVDQLLREFAILIEGIEKRGVEIVPLARLIGKEVMGSAESDLGPNAAELFYNGLAATYDEEQFSSAVSLSRGTEQRLFAARRAELLAGAQRVLEIGAGTGIFTLEIAACCQEVVAADISGNMLALLERKARAAGVENITTFKGDVEKMELAGPFSAACAFSSLEYLTDLPAFLAKLARQLEPGGRVYFITARSSLFRLFTQIGNAMRQGLWLRAHSRREMKSMLERAGFEQITIKSHLFKSLISGGMLLEVTALRGGTKAVPEPASAPTQAPPAGGLKTLLAIPVYNHAGTVRGVAQRALEQGFPVLVVDDGSTDGSLDAVADLPVGRHRLPENGGKGGAILAAARLAREWGYEALLTIDADGQHDPAEARSLVEAASGSWPAIVIGARRMETENVPRSSLFGRDFSNFWVRLECGRTLPDTQSGYRLYPVEFLQRSRFFSRRYTFEIEVLVTGSWGGLPLLSVPVSVYYPPDDLRVSHFHKFKDNLRLSLLHTFLVCRALFPWPHRRLFGERGEAGRMPGIFRPASYFRELSRQHSTPRELAAAVWVGVFLGALPIIPFGIAAIVYASHRLHLNKLASVGASNVCCAPFVPFLCVEIGHYLIHGSFWSEFNRHTLLEQLHHRLWEWLLGSLLVGPLLGGLFGLLTYLLVRLYRRGRQGGAGGMGTGCPAG